MAIKLKPLVWREGEDLGTWVAYGLRGQTFTVNQEADGRFTAFAHHNGPNSGYSMGRWPLKSGIEAMIAADEMYKEINEDLLETLNNLAPFITGDTL